MFWPVLVSTMVVCAAVASAALASVRVSVSPSHGKPATKFVIRFRAPSTTGTSGTMHSHYQVSATGPAGGGCTSSVSFALRPTRARRMVRATVRPRRHWCTGTFHGRIVEYVTMVCGPPQGGIVCPDIVIAPRTIGRFKFKVTGASSSAGSNHGTQNSGPTFAGLVSATYCTETPKILPFQKAVILTWNAASDPVTPSSQIVYDIYYATSPGGEDFSHPTWTTMPGQVSYTADVPQGPAYFVVRARDAAGLEDDNTVERVATQTCGAPPAT